MSHLTLQEGPWVTNAFAVQIEAVWRLWYVDRGMTSDQADRIDVDIKIEACGVCGSDVHTISGMFTQSTSTKYTNGS